MYEHIIFKIAAISIIVLVIVLLIEKVYHKIYWRVRDRKNIQESIEFRLNETRQALNAFSEKLVAIELKILELKEKQNDKINRKRSVK